MITRKQYIAEELYRMAELADRYVSLEKGAINAEG